MVREQTGEFIGAVDQRHLRIYCICGQKMKVSEDMFGLPAKCIACRQKIRVPRPEDLPPNTAEIHLKDYPQYLRKMRPVLRPSEEELKLETPPERRHEVQIRHKTPRERAADEVVPTTHEEDPPRTERVVADESTQKAEIDIDEVDGLEEEAVTEEKVDEEIEDWNTPTEEREEVPQKEAKGKEVPRKDIKKKKGVLPLDTLPPLQLLTSLTYKLTREKETIDEREKGRDPGRIDRYLVQVRDHRKELNEVLRQRLMETAIELTNTQDKIGQAELSVRVGEMDFPYYAQTVDRLRRRRERLEKRQRNLRGWLVVKDAHEAGGFIDRAIDALPKDGYDHVVPTVVESDEPLVSVLSDALRVAMLRREKAQRKLAEMDAMRKTDQAYQGKLAMTHRDTEGEKALADAAVEFYRERLKQAKSDLSNDIQGVEAQLELALGRLQVSEIDRVQFENEERYLVSAKTDCAKARSVVVRALSANTAPDVPSLRGTFLARLARRGEDDTFGLDSYLAWGSALVLFIGIFLPAGGNMSVWDGFHASSPSSLPLLTIGFLIALTAATGAIPFLVIRGLSLGAVWVATSIAWAALIHQTQFSVGDLATAFRNDALPFLRPGSLLFAAANLMVLAAFGVHLFKAAVPRSALAAAIVATCAILAAIVSDFGGYFLPEPTIDARVSGQAQSDGSAAGSRDVVITLANNGHRNMILSRTSSSAANTYRFYLEANVGFEQWRPVSTPKIPAASTFEVLRPRMRKVIPLVLPPGDYKATLQCDALDETSEARFSVGGEAQAPTETPTPEAEQSEPPEEVPSELAAEEPLVGEGGGATGTGPGLPAVELRGVLTSPDAGPRFSLTVYLPDGTSVSMKATVGERVFDTWEVYEYNPKQPSVTLRDSENHLLIVRPRNRVSFDSAF